MSLFIGSLAFEYQSASYLTDVKIGVLTGSLMAAVVGSVLIAFSQHEIKAISTSNEGRFSEKTSYQTN